LATEAGRLKKPIESLAKRQSSRKNPDGDPSCSAPRRAQVAKILHAIKKNRLPIQEAKKKLALRLGQPNNHIFGWSRIAS